MREIGLFIEDKPVVVAELLVIVCCCYYRDTNLM